MSRVNWLPRGQVICLYHRDPAIELLVLDEPTVGLDFVGLGALRDAVKNSPRAMVVVSHDHDFIESIDIRCEIRLGASGSHEPLRN